MEETIRNGGQFICVGIEPDPKSKEILNRMKQRAIELNHEGVLVLEDMRLSTGGFKFQGVWGSLARAGCTLCTFPSKYEPCGLVQGEANRYGITVVATKTGGFPDTLTEGFNGFLFTRMPDWDSREQNEQISMTLGKALDDAKQRQHILYYGTPEEQKALMDKKATIMRNAINSTWEQTPDHSLSASRQLELVYAKAIKNRNHIQANLSILQY
jgi:glycosyltransferase involved in cell wall biosynthesis